MASALARAKLARAAFALNAGTRLPAVILMTDAKRLADPLAAARSLPKGCAVIIRHTDSAARAALASRLGAVTRERGLYLLIAGDPELAARIGADGLHLPELRVREAAHWKALHPSWFVTAAAHSERALQAARRAGADAALIAPAFATRSHADRPSIGVTRLRLMAERANLPVYALGGVNEHTMGRLSGARLAGFAAIEALIPD